jgi:hypothetical protein
MQEAHNWNDKIMDAVKIKVFLRLLIFKAAFKRNNADI